MAITKKTIKKKKSTRKKIGERELTKKEKEYIRKKIAIGIRPTVSQKNRKRMPEIVYIKPDLTVMPHYAKEYKPEYRIYIDEYLHTCYESFAKRERYVNAPVRDEYKISKGKAVLVKQGTTREQLEDKDRYVPLVHLPSLAGFVMYLRFEKKLALNKEIIERFGEIDIEWKNGLDVIKYATEEFCLKMAANNIGQQNITSIILQNNAGYKVREPDGGGTTNNIFQMIYQHISSNVPEKFVPPEGKDIDVLLMKEKHANGETYGQ